MKFVYSPLFILIVFNLQVTAQVKYINSDFTDVSGKVRTVYAEEHRVKQAGDSLVRDTVIEKSIHRIFGGPGPNLLVFDRHRRLIESSYLENSEDKDYSYKVVIEYNSQDEIISRSSYSSAGKKIFYIKKKKGLNKHITRYVSIEDGKKGSGINFTNKNDSIVLEKSYSPSTGYSTVQYFYNDSGKRVMKVELADRPSDSTITIYKYNSFGNIIELTEKSRRPQVIKYQYDPLQHLMEIREDDRIRKYDANKNLIEDSSKYGGVKRWKYSGKTLLEETEYYSDTVPYSHYQYFYNKDNDRVRKVARFKDSSKNFMVTYKYDAQHNLVLETESDKRTVLDSTTYAYENNMLIDEVYYYADGGTSQTKYVNDTYGNWVKQITYTNGVPNYLKKRVITYFK